jgi:hypothetical protein
MHLYWCVLKLDLFRKWIGNQIVIDHREPQWIFVKGNFCYLEGIVDNCLCLKQNIDDDFIY